MFTKSTAEPVVSASYDRLIESLDRGSRRHGAARRGLAVSHNVHYIPGSIRPRHGYSSDRICYSFTVINSKVYKYKDRIKKWRLMGIERSIYRGKYYCYICK